MYNIQPKTLFTGKNAVYLPTCHSTNETASEIIQKNEIAEGTIVITDHQIKGKGQRGNEWHTQKGLNLTLTVIYKPHFVPVEKQFKLNMAVSLAVYDTFKKYLGDDLKIKWPNDIFYGDKKIAGILIESLISNKVMNYSLIGIGLNINQKDFDLPRATSLSNLTNYENYDLQEILIILMENMEKSYLDLKNGLDEFQRSRYTQNLFRKNEWHRFGNSEGVFEGRIKGVSETGKLIIETKFGLKQFDTKEFEYIY